MRRLDAACFFWDNKRTTTTTTTAASAASVAAATATANRPLYSLLVRYSRTRKNPVSPFPHFLEPNKRGGLFLRGGLKSRFSCIWLRCLIAS